MPDPGEAGIILPIVPCPAPRMSRKDRRPPYRDCVARYYAFRDAVRAANIDVPRNVKAVSLDFVLPMPRSWSKKKRREMDGEWHRQVPDIDNLVKAFLDSACMGNDSFVPGILACKTWGKKGQIEVKVHT